MSQYPQTPPFTEPIPNPPVGPEAERRLERNAEALQSIDPARAAGYQQQLEDPTTEFPGALSTATNADQSAIDSGTPTPLTSDQGSVQVKPASKPAADAKP